MLGVLGMKEAKRRQMLWDDMIWDLAASQCLAYVLVCFQSSKGDNVFCILP